MIPGQAQQFFEAAAAQAGGDHQVDRSLRFNSADSAYLNRTPSSAGNRKTWTWSGWVKRCAFGVTHCLFFGGATDSTLTRIIFGNDTLELQNFDSSTFSVRLETNALFRDPAAWYHFTVAVDTTQATAADRVKMYVNGVEQDSYLAATYPTQDQELHISNNVKHSIGLEDSSALYYKFDGYMAEIHFIDGQQLAASDFGNFDSNNVWQPKASSGSYGTNGFYLKFADNSSNAALGTDSSGNSNTWTVNNLQAVGSSWDQSQTWSSSGSGTPYTANFDWDKAFDGIITTSTDVTFGASDATMTWTPSSPITVNTSVIVYVYNATNGTSYGTRVNGSYITGTNNYNVPVTLTAATLGGQLTSIQLTNSGLVGPYLGGVEVDGVLLVDSGVADPAAKDIDSLIDTPTNYTAASGNNGGNYPTWNPLSQSSSTFSNGNLQATTSGGSGYPLETVNFYTPPGTGKWYWEFQLSALSGSNYTMVGMLPTDSDYEQGNSNIPSEKKGIGLYIGVNGVAYVASGAATAGTATATFGVGDILGWAFDAGNGTVQCYKNGVAQGTQFTNVRTDVGWAFCVTDYDNSATATYIINYGSRPFAYTPPTDYVSLCTTNLADPTIADGSTAFDVKLWNGNDTQRDITGLGFSPDLVWIKQRSGTALHSLQDTVRGATKNLVPNDTQSEGTETAYLNAFLSNGFSIGTSSTVNDGSSTYVGWTWDGGTSNTSISVGDLNSSFYNQSQVWSIAGTITNDLTSSNQGIDKAFDGSLDNSSQHYWFAQNGTTSRYTFPSVQTGTKFELYMAVSLTNTNFSVNGQQSSNVPASGLTDQWVDVTDAVTASGLGGLSYIEISYSGGQYSQYVFAIKIDGKTYVDAINDSQTWSDSLTALSGSLTNPPNGFDTDESTYADSTAGFTLDLSGHTFGTGAHTIEVKSGGATSFSVNGSTSLTDPGGGGAKVWTGTHTGELTSLVSSATGASLYYIKIDGKYLANPGQNYVGVPSIASTVRANPSAGFSVVSYTGSSSAVTVGHGLNAAPQMIIVKDRDNSYNWQVAHIGIGADESLLLNAGDAKADYNAWNNTRPTSSLFSLGAGTLGVNTNGADLIAYCFAPVEGYSAFGSYTGNGSADGPFVFTGMRPRWLMVKSSSNSGEHWLILDTERDPHNLADATIYANLSNAEAEAAVLGIDILSNGFKCKGTNAGANASGYTYVYAAFASHPFKTARAR